MFTLFFDTDCEITPTIAKKYNARLISMPYSIDGEETFPYIDFETYDAHAFNDMMRKGVLPSTSAISVEEYRRYFEPELEKGNDILYVHFSRSMSATFGNIDEVKKELLEKYPERRIELVDTKFITLGSYAICTQIGDLYNQGKSLDEIIEWAKTGIYKQGFYFFADNLKFFARSGRVSGFTAFMGGMIGIKPIIYIGDDGKMTTIDRAVGRKKVLEKLLQYVIDAEENIKSYPVYIAHGDAQYLVDEFVPMLKKQFGEDLHIEVLDINPTIASHCGPDCLGVTFHAKHR